MRLERVQRWQWMAISVVVGAALAYARRDDPEALLSRLGEGVADQQWFEQQLQRRVPLADGSTVPAFGRLTVYPLTLTGRGQRPHVHVVAGMALVEDRPRRPQLLPTTIPTSVPAGVGKLRPFFYIAPVPFQPLADRQAGKSPAEWATVRDYLNGLKPHGVTYAYAWWADARYAAAAWVCGSFLLLGVVWPTIVNLLAYGTLGRPHEEKGVSLWRVKTSRAESSPRPTAMPAPTHPLAAAMTDLAPAEVESPTGPSPAGPAPALLLEPVTAGSTAHDAHKEFGARRDDFYPTELKASHPTEAHGGGH
jgi:hypothetical protein